VAKEKPARCLCEVEKKGRTGESRPAESLKLPAGQPKELCADSHQLFRAAIALCACQDPRPSMPVLCDSVTPRFTTSRTVK